MFTNTKDLKELVIRASDGELGAVDQLYFDDETWALRYLTVSTGGWFGGREVLISPMSIIGADWASKRLDVALTMKQVEESPDIDTHRPVSRQQEAAYLSYYGFPFYWDGPHMGGKVYFAAGAGIFVGIGVICSHPEFACRNQSHSRRRPCAEGCDF